MKRKRDDLMLKIRSEPSIKQVDNNL